MNIGVIYIRVYEEAEDFLMMNISGPREGDFITIKSYKHDGSLHRTWRDTMVLKTSENALIGCNDHTLVTESDGRTWHTKEPAVLYFFKNQWFNIIGQCKKNGIYYYCNIASPYIIEEGTIKYIDYDLDLRVFPDGSFKVLDRGEYKYHKSIMNYSDDLDMILKSELTTLINMVRNKDPMFNKETIEKYNHIYNEMKQKMKK